MSCPALTNKGGKLYISEEPVECDATVFDIAGAAYVQVPGVGSIGDTGIQQDIVTYSTINGGLTAQGKGDATGINWDIEILDRPSAAKDILDEAASPDNADSYATRVEWADGESEYLINQVHSPTYVKGLPAAVRVIRYSFMPSIAPIRVPYLPVQNLFLNYTPFVGFANGN